MDVVIAGGHGQIALRLARQLSRRGERVRSLIRNPDHASDVSEAGAEAVVFDLEEGSSAGVAGGGGGGGALGFSGGGRGGGGGGAHRGVRPPGAGGRPRERPQAGGGAGC